MIKFFALTGIYLVVAAIFSAITWGTVAVFLGGYLGCHWFKKGR